MNFLHYDFIFWRYIGSARSRRNSTKVYVNIKLQTYKETYQINAFNSSKWDKAYVLILFKLYILYFYSNSSWEQISNPATGLPTMEETVKTTWNSINLFQHINWSTDKRINRLHSQQITRWVDQMINRPTEQQINRSTDQMTNNQRT